jgi:hypothetical protein
MKRISQREGEPQAFVGPDSSYKPISMDQAKEQAAQAIEAKPVYLDSKGRPRKPNKQSEGLSYEEWEQRLSALVSKYYGLGMSDFPDWNSMDAYEDDLSVAEGFSAFKEEQGFDE